MKSPQDNPASIARARTEGYAHNQNPPCLMTSEGLEQMMALVRADQVTPERASALAMLSIAASLIKITEMGSIWCGSIEQAIDFVSKTVSEFGKDPTD